MLLTPTSADSAWGVGLYLLAIPTPLPVELSLTPGDYSLARGTLGRDNSGNVEGTIGSASLAGTMYLSCCFSEPDPVEPPKRQPNFLGNQD